MNQGSRIPEPEPELVPYRREASGAGARYGADGDQGTKKFIFFLTITLLLSLSSALPALAGCCVIDNVCTRSQSARVCATGLGEYFDKDCSAVPACPAAPEEKQFKVEPISPTLQINIPTLPKFSQLPSKADAEGNIYIPFLGEYLAAIYRYAVSIVGIVAAVFIIYGGFEYLTSGGAADKVTRAKETIGNALIALFLVLGSYVVFYTIDPELVQFKYLKIKVIQNVPLPPDTDQTDLSDTDTTSEEEAGLQLITSENIDAKTLDGTKPMMVTEAAQALVRVSEDFFGLEGKKLKITSGYRSWEEQEEKYKRNCSTLPCTTQTCKPRLKDGKKIANCPHTSGVAVDLVCANVPTAPASQDPCQKKLEEVMIRAGFCRLYGNRPEAWHFEWNAKKVSKTACLQP